DLVDVVRRPRDAAMPPGARNPKRARPAGEVGCREGRVMVLSTMFLVPSPAAQSFRRSANPLEPRGRCPIGTTDPRGARPPSDLPLSDAAAGWYTAATKVHQYPRCSTCRKALGWLDAHGVQYTAIDIVERPPPAAELAKVARLSELPVAKLFHTSGQVCREGNYKQRLASMSDADA